MAEETLKPATSSANRNIIYDGATLTWENITVFANESQSTFSKCQPQNRAKKQILRNGLLLNIPKINKIKIMKFCNFKI